MAVKEPKEERQLAFFTALFESGNVEVAREAGGYTVESMHRLLKDFKDYIAEHANGTLAVGAVKAATELTNTLEWTGEDMPHHIKSIRLKAATEILDRQGVVKTDRLKVESETGLANIFVLPEKEIAEVKDE